MRTPNSGTPISETPINPQAKRLTSISPGTVFMPAIPAHWLQVQMQERVGRKAVKGLWFRIYGSFWFGVGV